MIDTKLLRQKILDLAIRGKLVPQNPADEPASELLKKIKAEKDALVKAGKIKKDKHESCIFKGDDNRYYEQIDGRTADITDEIPFDLPDNWAWCRFFSVLDVRDGTHDTPKYVSSGIPLVTSKNLIDGKIDIQTAKLISIEDAQAINMRSCVDNNDILFAMIGTIGNPVLVNKRFDFCIKNIALFKVISHKCFNMKYLLLYLQKEQYTMRDKTSSGLQPFVSLNFLRNYLIPLPPLSEQQRIVEQIETLLGYVDIIDADAETLEKSITLAKQKILDLAIRGKLVSQDPADEPASELLKKIKAEKDALVKAGKIKKDKHESYIFKSDDNCYYEQLNGKTTDITAEIPFELPESWCWCRLRSLGQIVGGGTPSTTNQMFWNGSIPWLSPADLTGYTDMYIAHGKKSITEEGIEKSSAVLMPAGSVLYSSRAPIGYVVISKNPISTNQGFKSLVPAIAGMSEFYYYALKARTSDIKQRATGTTFKEISGNDFGNTLVPLPPITEQKRIVQAIAQYNSILELISK